MTNRNQLVRHARKRSGLVAREVAYRLGVTESRLHKLETTATVTEATLKRLEDAGFISREERITALLGQDAAA